MIIYCRPSSTGCLQREPLETKSKLLCFSLQFSTYFHHPPTIQPPPNPILPISPPPSIHHGHNLSVFPTHCLSIDAENLSGQQPLSSTFPFFIPPLNHPFVLFFLVQAFKSWRHSHGPPGQLFLLQTSTLELIWICSDIFFEHFQAQEPFTNSDTRMVKKVMKKLPRVVFDFLTLVGGLCSSNWPSFSHRFDIISTLSMQMDKVKRFSCSWCANIILLFKS